ncbi:MAG: hypothetical protein GXO11_06650 [Epsilonproteobacteria bacterium]|nr:hypothetical protein [Campylobacterota bacterium]
MKFLLLFVLYSSLLFATDLLKVKEYKLTKDKTVKILVKYGSFQKTLSFRWTLYKNDGLVVFSSYDRIVSQHVLYLNHTNQSIRIQLKSRASSNRVASYLLLKFDQFDFQKHRATISLWLADKNKEISLKYLK